MPATVRNTRKKLRFAPDPSMHAEIDFDTKQETFRCEMPALIFNESYSGCCVVAMKEKRFKVGSKFRIKVGLLAPLYGEIRWVNMLDNDFIKMGVEFLE